MHNLKDHLIPSNIPLTVASPTLEYANIIAITSCTAYFRRLYTNLPWSAAEHIKWYTHPKFPRASLWI